MAEDKRNRTEQRLARKLQRDTGRKYTDCLAEVRLMEKAVKAIGNKEVGE